MVERVGHPFLRAGVPALLLRLLFSPFSVSLDLFAPRLFVRRYLSAMSSSPEEAALKVGWLSKRGKLNKAWKRRYFKLKPHLLEYFNTGYAKQPKGAIALSTVLDCCRSTNPMNPENTLDVVTKASVRKNLCSRHGCRCGSSSSSSSSSNIRMEKLGRPDGGWRVKEGAYV